VGLAERTKRRVIAISEASRRDAVRYLGLRPGRVTAIPLAAGAAFRPAEDRGAPRARLAARGFPDRYLLYIGNTRPHKNVRRLLRAYAALVREGVEMPPLVLGGLDDMRQDAGVAWPARAAAELGIQGRVRLTGVMTDAELADAYRGALALAIPSIYEGFGLEALEAMACGTPVLAGRGGALVEVVGDAGLLVEPRETAAIAAGLRRLVEDAALREQLAAAGVARAATFSWERTADAILGVLLEAAR